MSGFLCSMVGATFTVAAVAQVLRSKKGITAVGNAQVDTAQSKFGGASALFDGTGDYLTFSQSSDLTLGTNNFTVEMWVRPNNTAAQYQPVFSLDGNGYPLVLFQMTSGVMEGYISTSGSSWDFANVNIGTFTAGNWYHISVVRNGSTFAWYLNGTQTQTRTSSSSIIAQRSAGRIGTSDSPYYWNGWVDEVRISNSARYTANFTAPTEPFVNDANTVLLIHADGTDASTFFEDDNGTGRSQLGIGAFGGATLSTAQSKFGSSSLDFGDGVGDYYKITAPTTSYFGGTGDMTFEFQYYRKSSGSGGHITDFRSGGGDAAWTIVDFEDGATTRLGLYQNGYIIASNIAVPSTTWTHIALVRQGTTVKWYKNGTLTDTSTAASGAWSNRTDCFVGANFADQSAGNNTNAYIDEIRISSTARYTANFTAPTQPFVNDANTLLLIHGDGTNGSTVIRDDNGVRAPIGISANGNAQITTTQSQFSGTSLSLDGNGDYLRTQFDLPAVKTLECWIRLNNVSGEKYVFRFHNSSDTFSWTFGVLNANSYLFSGGTTTSGTLSTNTWTHLCLVDDGSSMTMAVNGVFGSQRGSVGAISNCILYLGGFTNNLGVNGFLDEVRVSNIARYTANFTAPTEPFVNDANTVLLIHADGTDGSTAFFDDNGIAPYTP
jgi:hypothetical protein